MSDLRLQRAALEQAQAELAALEKAPAEALLADARAQREKALLEVDAERQALEDARRLRTAVAEQLRLFPRTGYRGYFLSGWPLTLALVLPFGLNAVLPLRGHTRLGFTLGAFLLVTTRVYRSWRNRRR